MKMELRELANEIEVALLPLGQAATVLHVLIENYNLDKLNPSQDEMLDIGIHHSEIHDTLLLVMCVLQDTGEKIERIIENAERKGEA